MPPDDVTGPPVPDHGLDQAEAIDARPRAGERLFGDLAGVVGRGLEVGDPHPLELQVPGGGGLLGRGGRGLAGPFFWVELRLIGYLQGGAQGATWAHGRAGPGPRSPGPPPAGRPGRAVVGHA